MKANDMVPNIYPRSPPPEIRKAMAVQSVIQKNSADLLIYHINEECLSCTGRISFTSRSLAEKS